MIRYVVLAFVLTALSLSVVGTADAASNGDLAFTKDVDLVTADPYDVLTYTLTVSNAGTSDTSYWISSVTDQGCAGLSPVGNAPAPNSGFSLDPGASWQYTCHYDFFDGTTYVNTACVHSYGNDETPFDLCDDATTTLAKHVVTGQAFDDLNADGVRQEGEPALAGVVLYADLNNNSARDEGEPSATTDAAGNYSLSVPLGTTTLRQDVPAGTTCSFPAGCAYTVDLAKNSPPQVPSRRISNKAADPTGKDFGNWRPASVSGAVTSDQGGGLAGVIVYVDANANGSFDSGEPTATTALDGTYAIGGLKPGGYTVRQVVPDGLTCAAPAGCYHSLTVTSGGSAANRDFLDAAPQPQQAVLKERIVAGTARLAGKTGCVSVKGFSARVRGSEMQRVVFLVDGHTLKSISLPKNNLSYRVNVRSLKVGRHTLTVRVTFKSESRTKPKTLRLNFQRCAEQLAGPRFTG